MFYLLLPSTCQTVFNFCDDICNKCINYDKFQGKRYQVLFAVIIINETVSSIQDFRVTVDK